MGKKLGEVRRIAALPERFGNTNIITSYVLEELEYLSGLEDKKKLSVGESNPAFARTDYTISDRRVY